MAYQNATESKHRNQTTPTQSVWATVFEELKRFFHHALGLGNSLRDAAAHLRGLLESGRTLLGLAAQYLW